MNETSTWPLVPLGDLAETALGKMLDGARPKGNIMVPYLRNSNVQWGRIDLDDLLQVPLSAEELLRFDVAPGDLLVCEGGEIGRAAVWTGRTGHVAYQKALHRVRTGGRLETHYLRYLLEYYASTSVLAQYATGSTIKHLPQQQLRKLPVPLPPVEEQLRIVELLESHLSRLDAAKVLLRSSSAREPQLLAAWLAAQPALRGAPTRPLSSLLESPLRHGRSVPTSDEGFPVLRLTALKGPHVDLSERKTGAWRATEALAFLVRRGDFLVARGSGSLHLVGRGSLVDINPDPVAFPDTAIKVRVSQAEMTPDFLALVWNSRPIRLQVEASAKTTAGIHKVNQADLGRVMLPVPDLETQKHLVVLANDFVTRIEHVHAAVAGSRRRAAALRRSLLAAAFSGRLTRPGVASPLEPQYV